MNASYRAAWSPASFARPCSCGLLPAVSLHCSQLHNSRPRAHGLATDAIGVPMHSSSRSRHDVANHHLRTAAAGGVNFHLSLRPPIPLLYLDPVSLWLGISCNQRRAPSATGTSGSIEIRMANRRSEACTVLRLFHSTTSGCRFPN